MRFKDSHTLTASYLSLITQAAVNNLAPLLLLTFRAQWGLSLEQLTLLTTLVLTKVAKVPSDFKGMLASSGLGMTFPATLAAGSIVLLLVPELL